MNMNRSLDALNELFEELGRIFAQLEQGDLTGALLGSYPGDFAQLQTNLNRSIAQLRSTLLTLASDTNQVSTAAIQTAAAAHEVARTSEEQLATLKQIAGAIEIVSTSMTEIAQNAEVSNKLTTSAVDLVATGSERLANLLSAVQRVAESQSRVERITDTITRIADKTHVLAINAGLEAARAGEHGIGFGFVAQQIGRLAEDSAVAARDISAIITSAVENIDRSSQDADAASAAISQVVRATREVGSNVTAITRSITVQSNEIAGLSRRIEELQAGGEGSASAAEEISVTMEHLVKLAGASQAMVAKLKLIEEPEDVVAVAAD
jgi:methyl-accepting chemotaxis protein